MSKLFVFMLIFVAFVECYAKEMPSSCFVVPQSYAEETVVTSIKNYAQSHKMASDHSSSVSHTHSSEFSGERIVVRLKFGDLGIIVTSYGVKYPKNDLNISQHLQHELQFTAKTCNSLDITASQYL